MKTTIYMMRHGGVENPQGILYERLAGFPLSQEGKEQALAMAKKFEAGNIKLCQIVSSPLARTAQTAAIIADHLKVPMRTDERLTEWGVGFWAGRTVKEFYEKSGYYKEPMNMAGLEPHDQTAIRVLSVVDELKRECAGKPSLIVSHRESLASAILKLQGGDYSSIHDVPMPKASVWQLDFADGQFVSAKLKWEAPRT